MDLDLRIGWPSVLMPEVATTRPARVGVVLGLKVGLASGCLVLLVRMVKLVQDMGNA